MFQIFPPFFQHPTKSLSKFFTVDPLSLFLVLFARFFPCLGFLLLLFYLYTFIIAFIIGRFFMQIILFHSFCFFVFYIFLLWLFINAVYLCCLLHSFHFSSYFQFYFYSSVNIFSFLAFDFVVFNAIIVFFFIFYFLFCCLFFIFDFCFDRWAAFMYSNSLVICRLRRHVLVLLLFISFFLELLHLVLPLARPIFSYALQLMRHFSLFFLIANFRKGILMWRSLLFKFLCTLRKFFKYSKCIYIHM